MAGAYGGGPDTAPRSSDRPSALEGTAGLARGPAGADVIDGARLGENPALLVLERCPLDDASAGRLPDQRCGRRSPHARLPDGAENDPRPPHFRPEMLQDHRSQVLHLTLVRSAGDYSFITDLQKSQCMAFDPLAPTSRCWYSLPPHDRLSSPRVLGANWPSLGTFITSRKRASSLPDLQPSRSTPLENTDHGGRQALHATLLVPGDAGRGSFSGDGSLGQLASSQARAPWRKASPSGENMRAIGVMPCTARGRAPLACESERARATRGRRRPIGGRCRHHFLFSI